MGIEASQELTDRLHRICGDLESIENRLSRHRVPRDHDWFQSLGNEWRRYHRVRDRYRHDGDTDYVRQQIERLEKDVDELRHQVRDALGFKERHHAAVRPSSWRFELPRERLEAVEERLGSTRRLLDRYQDLLSDGDIPPEWAPWRDRARRLGIRLRALQPDHREYTEADDRELLALEADPAALHDEVRAAVRRVEERMGLPERERTAARSRSRRHDDRSFRVSKGYGTGRYGLLPRPRRGLLTRFGYHLHDSPLQRHRALDRAVREYGGLSTFHKVNLLSGYFKRVPEALQAVREDKEYLQRFLKGRSRSRHRHRKRK